MTTTSKRQQKRVRALRTRRRRTSATSKKVVKSTLTPEPKPLEKVMFVLEPADLEWLDATVAGLKAVRRRTSKSELMRLAISIMKKMEPEELRQQLRELD